MERYTLDKQYKIMLKSEHGEYVKYEDVQKIISDLSYAGREALEWNWLDDDFPKEVKSRILSLLHKYE